MSRIALAVQTHPARAELAADLAERLGGAELVFDPEPTAYRSPWRTYRTALERYVDSDYSHLLVIQDDTTLAPNFRAALDLVVAARPDDLVTLFVAGLPVASRNAVWKASERGETFALLPEDRWVPAIAIVWPVGLIRAALDFVAAQGWPVEFSADDEILGRLSRALGYRVWATVPCLVEHPDLVESLTNKWRSKGGHDLGRVACCFNPDCDPLIVPWTSR